MEKSTFTEQDRSLWRSALEAIEARHQGLRQPWDLTPEHQAELDAAPSMFSPETMKAVMAEQEAEALANASPIPIIWPTHD